MTREALHEATFRLNSILFVAFLSLAVWMGVRLPERYPMHFRLSGEITSWAEGPGIWVFLVAICTISFGKLHLFQRFLVTDPDSGLLNVPHKKLFRQLPRERRLPVMRRANRMLGLCNTGLLLMYLSLLFLVFHAGHNPGGVAARVAHLSSLLVLVLLLVVPLAEGVAMSRMVKRKLREEGLLP